MNYGSPGSRFVAFLIDAVILWAINFVVVLVLSGIIKQSQAIAYVFELIISIGYWVVYQSKATQTVGKRLMHLKVVDASGKTPSMMTFFLREIIGKFISAIILLIGYLMILWDGKRQGLHDKIASTFVVKV